MPSTGGGGLAMVPNLRGVLPLLKRGWHTQGEKGELNVLPWYRPVGVVSTSSEDAQEGRPGCPARVSGHHMVRG